MKNIFYQAQKKIKGKGYFDAHKMLITGYNHVIRRNRARMERIERKRFVKIALIIIAVNYLPFGNFGFDAVLAAKNLKLLGIGM